MNQFEAPTLEAWDLLRRSGLAPLQIQPAGKGSNHFLFVVELDSDAPMHLLRVPRDHDHHQAVHWLRSEAEAVRRASGTILVPNPVTLLPDSRRPEGTLMPILAGQRASDLRGHTRMSRIVGELCILLARTLGELHKIEFPENEPTAIPVGAPGFLQGGDRLLHGDAHLGNLLVEQDEKGDWKVTGMIDWAFSQWGPPEADLVEMAICEAEPRPMLGRLFLDAYMHSSQQEPREDVFKWALIRELERRLDAHAQAQEQAAKDAWTRWLAALHRPGARALQVFSSRRLPGQSLV